MSVYEVTFERIGRTHGPFTELFDAADPDDLAEKVWQFARTRLGSRMYGVDVDLEVGKGSIEYGRFGTFTVEEVAE